MNLKISFRKNIETVYNKTVRELVDDLQEAYCSTVGFEYMHIQGREQCNFLRKRISEKETMSKEDRHNLLDRLTWATVFEKYLGIIFFVLIFR